MKIFDFSTKEFKVTEHGLLPSTGNWFKDLLPEIAGMALFILILLGMGLALFGLMLRVFFGPSYD